MRPAHFTGLRFVCFRGIHVARPLVSFSVTFIPYHGILKYNLTIHHYLSLFYMQKLIATFTLGMMLFPGAAVLAGKDQNMGVSEYREEMKDEKKLLHVEKKNFNHGICISASNKKEQQTLQAARQVRAAAIQAARNQLQTDKAAAQLLTDMDQRELAIERAQYVFEDAQLNAESVMRVARRAAAHQAILDRQACRAQFKQAQSCVKTAAQKMEEALKGAMTTYQAALATAQTKYEADKLAAMALPEGSARNAALLAARHALEDARLAAQNTHMQARRAIQSQSLTDKEACVKT